MISLLKFVFCDLALIKGQDHKFYDHGEYDPSDYNMFDTFEPYTWHKYEHSAHSQKVNMREFYLQKQWDKEFGELTNVQFDVDIISLDGTTKPRYNDNKIYPAQDSDIFNRGFSSVAANAFRQGYSTRSFANMEIFNYRADGVQQNIRQVKFQTEGEQAFQIRFNINQILMHTRLDEDLMEKMKSSQFYQDLVTVLLKDHQISKRQYTFYKMDCRFDSKIRDLCNSRELTQFQNQINKEYGEIMYLGIYFTDEEMMDNEQIADEIESLLRKQFDPETKNQRHDPSNGKDLANMFKQSMPMFTRYLQEDLGPKVVSLNTTFSVHQFTSPLDFIMIKSDFKRFYESFTQARLSLLYSLEFHKSSIFITDHKRQRYQLDMSDKLYKNFAEEVTEMHVILSEYKHLLIHDNFDCSSHMMGKDFLFRCWFKRYGFPLVTFSVFLAGSFFYLKGDLFDEGAGKKVGSHRD